jgi:hypothetical protein
MPYSGALDESALTAHLGGAELLEIVVVNQPERTRQPIEIGQEVTVVEIGSSMQHEEWLAASDVSRVERRGSSRDPALPRAGG